MAATITITTNTTAKPANSISEALLSGSALMVLMLLVLNTAAFGGALDEAVFASQVLILSAMAFQACLALIEKSYLDELGSPARIALTFFAAFVAFGALQSRFGSAYPFATRESVIRLLFYLAYLFVCLKVAAHRRLADRMAATLAVLAFTTTMLGLLQKLSGTDKIYWIRDFGTRTFFGPFVYENNFGAFIGLTFPLVLGLAVYRYLSFYRTWEEEPGRNVWGLWAGLANNGCLFFGFISTLMLIASFHSQARAPSIIMSAFFIAAFAGITLRQRSKKLVLVFTAVAAIFLVLASQIDLGKALTYYKPGDLASSLSFRMRLLTDTFRMFLERPIAGWGLGTVFAASNRFLSVPMEFVSYAHPNNDYMELIAETGLAGSVLVGAGLAGLVLPSAALILRTKSLWAKSMAIQAVLALCALAVMIAADSHLKLPGIAYLFLFQLAVLAGATRPKGAGRGSSRASRAGTLAAIIGLSVFLFAQTLRFFEARLVPGSLDSPEIVQTQIHAEPDNAIHWHRLAFHHYRNGQRKESLEAMRRAAELNPVYAHYRFVLGQLHYYYGDKLKGIESLEKSAALAPANRSYGLFLLGVYLAEKEKVVSSTRKQAYEDSARGLYARLIELPYPPEPINFQVWMYRYDATLLDQLKGE